VLKLIVVVTVLLIGGGWMMDTLIDYTMELFDLIAA
jgi:flagellar biosynthesis protein FliQ